ncbi:NAD(P)/FAD-dependent oxidoreductase [Candidatus Laterigemmans baculatus]|uniref:NAD(P)/FAD-dependent oxidoreductase n=1 Tax=Candidatus Laterigemmans baculatus TaxID=2770505 RepID=UPI0013DA0884|nr:FAD-dependent monooxygenase [Candidatus Laterigemmans baculatus]
MNHLPTTTERTTLLEPTASQDAPWVVVIGGGPAGSIAALQLTRTLSALGERRGAGDESSRRPRVLLVDREDFPRGKVCGCCLNGAAIAALDAAGLKNLPEELAAVPLTHWEGQIAGLGKRPRVARVRLPSGWAVSRESLDAALLSRARAAGAVVRTGVVARVRTATDEAVEVELKSSAGTETVFAAAVVVASGLSGGGLEPLLPWRQPPAGPVGLGTTLVASEAEYVPGKIYMACDGTGYAGLVRLEDGRLDIAAAVYDPSGPGRRRGAGERVAEILQAAGMPPVAGIETAAWRGTPRLHRQRQPGRGRIVAVGDAAGYVEPFTGEGMAWGMQTGLLAARVIAEALARQSLARQSLARESLARESLSPEPAHATGRTPTPSRKSPRAAAEIGVRYTYQYNRLLSRRRTACRLLTAALRPRWSRRMLFQSLAVAPWLAAPVVRMLNRPHSP